MFLNRALRASGSAKLHFVKLNRQQLRKVDSWGKHFILQFDTVALRIHFLMFGSYRINNPRENRVLKLTLKIGKDIIHFYSCAIKVLDGPYKELYGWSTDIMSLKFNRRLAGQKLKNAPEEFVCDALMDQTIFSGVGNIIKNEVLFRQKIHHQTKLGQMTQSLRACLVKDTQKYCHLFYAWKKDGELKRNWQVMRKKTCPLCGRALTKAPTGRGKRISFYCKKHQPKYSQLTVNRA